MWRTIQLSLFFIEKDYYDSEEYNYEDEDSEGIKVTQKSLWKS